MLRYLAYLLLAIAAFPAPAAEPEVTTVTAQPLASNARRLLQAFESLGYPLPDATSAALRQAIDQLDAGGIQKALDQHVLGVVSISPEERVSAVRGPSKAQIQQAGFTPLLLKVINHSTSTAWLRVASPNAGPVYAGTAQLSMQRQQQLQLLDNQNNEHSRERFLSLEVFRRQPMTERLSGLEVEYVILLVASSESGKREAILDFNLGENTADLEHRSELPILFDVQPAIPISIKVMDADGSPSIARLEIRDANNRVYPLQAKRVAPDFFFQSHVYRADSETVLLPPGKFNVTSSRGPEYLVKHSQLDVSTQKENALTIQLDRWFDAASHGYFSGDHHIHAAGCAHYTHPTQGVTPQDMFRQVKGEGLNVGCVLTWGPCFDHQRQYFQETANAFGTKDTLLKYDLEISGFGSQALGHVCLLNLRDQVYPGSAESKSKGWPTWTTPVMRWAKQQGGYTGYAHSASGLQINPAAASKRLMNRFDSNGDGSLDNREYELAFLPFPTDQIDSDGNEIISTRELILSHQKAADELPNYAIPEMSGVGAMEICVSTVAGVCDFISAMDTARIQEWNTWYHLLNCGFPIKVSGETDFPCMSSRRVGKGRVYVHLGKESKLDFGNWCRSLALGRSYVSDGYAHFGLLTVNGARPGYRDVQLTKPASVNVVAQVAFAPQTPIGVAYGNAASRRGRSVVGDTVNLHRERDKSWQLGGDRKVEVVVNGQVVATHTIPADGKLHQIESRIAIDQSSWVAVRHFPQLHSNPVNVIVGNQPIRANQRSAQWCIEMTGLLWKNRERAIAADERADARAAFDYALKTLSEIATECPH